MVNRCSPFSLKTEKADRRLKVQRKDKKSYFSCNHVWRKWHAFRTSNRNDCQGLKLFKNELLHLICNFVGFIWEDTKKLGQVRIGWDLNNQVFDSLSRSRQTTFFKWPNNKCFRLVGHMVCTITPLLQCEGSHGQHLNQWT